MKFQLEKTNFDRIIRIESPYGWFIVVEWSNDRRIQARKHTRTPINKAQSFENSKYEQSLVRVITWYEISSTRTHAHCRAHSTYRCAVLQVTLCMVRSLEIGYVHTLAFVLLTRAAFARPKPIVLFRFRSICVCVWGKLPVCAWVCCIVLCYALCICRIDATATPYTRIHTRELKKWRSFSTQQRQTTSTTTTSQQHRIGHCVHFVMMSRLDCS